MKDKTTRNKMIISLYHDNGTIILCEHIYLGLQWGVCSTDLRLYTSTNALKQVYTSPEAIYQQTYFLKNVHLKIIYNF
jgi:hypothetical protein